MIPMFRMLDAASWIPPFSGLDTSTIVITLIGLLATYKVVHALFISPLRNVPGPFLAHLTGARAYLLSIAGRQGHMARQEHEQYGDIYMYKPNAVSISCPADVRLVLGSHSFPKTDHFKGINVLGVVTTASAIDPHVSKMKRRQIAPYFNNVYLAQMEPAILRCGILAIKEKWDRMIGDSSDGRAEINYQRDFLHATFDTIGTLTFGKSFDALKNDDSTVAGWMTGSIAYKAARTLFPPLAIFPFSLLIWHIERRHNMFVDYSAQCIAERRQLLADIESGKLEKAAKPSDLLQGFIDAEDPQSRTRMTPVEVHSESMQMLILGSKSSSNTLLFTVHLLMLHPQHYKRAADEVRLKFGKDHVISYSEAKPQLPFVDACIYESMRVFPTTGGQFPRAVCKGGVTLSGHFLPEGTEVNINISGTNMNKSYWKEPHLFNPCRFLDNDEAKREVYTFGIGVRVCPGRNLAMLQILTILANLLKDYDFQLPEDYTLRGPSILDGRGYPKLMDTKYRFASNPANPKRDCRLVVSKRK